MRYIGIGGACRLCCTVAAVLGVGLVAASWSGVSAQPPASPPAVGVVTVSRQPVARSSEYTGRIQATDRVNVVARVTAYLGERFFTEGAEVKKGDLLYRLEQGPFQADVQAKEAAVAQFKAQLQNAEVVLSRAQTLLKTQAGPQSTVDETLANEQALKAQVLAAEAQLQQSQINLGYTEIRAPIDGKIGRTAVTVGNYVGPGTGVLTTMVSQDPMYVVFPVSTRNVLALSQRTASEGGNAVVIKIRLPDGSLYGQAGKLDFIDNTVAPNTDTMILRGVVPNPLLSAKGDGKASDGKASDGKARELVDGEFVTIILEDAKPVEALTIPRSAILTDQAGDYVFAVGADKKVQQRRVQLGQSSPTTVVVTSGLTEGESIITEGIQRARPGLVVAPGPASAPATQTGSLNSPGQGNKTSNGRGDAVRG